MTNVYGYNRKTPEEDKAILAAVKRHHERVEKEGFIVVMTSLVGSQNYDLDTPLSDIDTFSLVFPNIMDIAMGKEPYSGLISLKDGHANIKDIRVALGLLKKTSPNSIEYFTSKYKIYTPEFEPICREYLEDNTRLWYMTHCNYEHMLYAMAGMAHQLTKRNMSAGKRFSHALRLDDMSYHFFNSATATAVLDLRAGGDRELALAAKTNTDENNDENYNNECEQIAARLDYLRENFNKTEAMKINEQQGLALIDSFQWKLFKQYLMETNKE